MDKYGGWMNNGTKESERIDNEPLIMNELMDGLHDI